MRAFVAMRKFTLQPRHAFLWRWLYRSEARDGPFFFAEICNLFRAMAKLPNPTNFLPNSLE
jgi:hypothetical protein